MAAFKVGLNEYKKGLCSVVACDIRALDVMNHKEKLSSPVFLKFSKSTCLQEPHILGSSEV